MADSEPIDHGLMHYGNGETPAQDPFLADAQLSMGFDDDLSYFIESTPTNAATVPLERSGPSTSGSLNSQPTATVIEMLPVDFDAYLNTFSWDEHAQDGHTAASEPLPHSSALASTISPTTSSVRGGDSTRRLSVSGPALEGPLGAPEINTGSWLPILNDSNNADTDWTYDCLNKEEPSVFKIPVPVPIAPKPPTIRQDLQSPIRPQPPSIDGSSLLVSNKRKRFDDKGRAKVKSVRRLGACFRCRISKLLSRNEELPYVNCSKVKDSQKIYRGSCVRLNIDEVQTFRAGDGDSGNVRAVLPKFQRAQGSVVKILQIQWPFRRSAVNTPVLTTMLEKFQPKRENLIEEYVANGIVHEVELPPWACRDTTVARKDIEQFMINCQSLFEDEIRETPVDPILLLTWNEVQCYRATYGTQLLSRALQIYASAMLCSRYPASIVTDFFGVADQVHTPHFFEKLPLSPTLTWQIQTIVALAMMDIQTLILKDLKARIFSKDRFHPWYEVFLAIFVLLAVVEWVYQVQIRFLKAKQGVSNRLFTDLSFATQHMLEEWETSAFNLIGHFRCIINGEVPFQQSWDDDAENPRRTGLDHSAVAYIRNIKRVVEERKEELYGLQAMQCTERFEKPLAVICE